MGLTYLQVDLGTVTDFRTGEHWDESWLVRHVPTGYTMVRGFGRKADAEIALKVMNEIGLDWSLPEKELRADWDAYGGRPAVMKKICEHLQW